MKNILTSLNLFALNASAAAGKQGGAGVDLGAFSTIVSYASMAVTLFGAGIAIAGLINFGEGKSQQNAGKQDEGISKLVGGGIIIVVGLALVPKLAEWIKV